MYQIALCDDETAELYKAERMLRAYEKIHPQLELVIRHFENADELLYMIREENYMPDLIFMDIYMPDKRGNRALGMEAAGELRRMAYRGKLVFLTTSKEHALEAFDVDASHYLVKPLLEERLFLLMDRLLEDAEGERRRYVLLRIDGRTVRVSINDIVYCEAQGKTQGMYLADGTQCLLRMSLLEISQMLAHCPEFVRIGASFIVNLGCITSLNAKELHMDNGRTIYLPRGAYKGLREQYFSYYCREI